MMEDFDDLCGRALSDYPLYERIVSDKIDGMQNIEIQADIEEQFAVKHSLEYISSLWRKKIPKIIASQAEDDTLNWYFLNKEKGKYKRCSRCGEIKLAHNKYFSISAPKLPSVFYTIRSFQPVTSVLFIVS